MSVVSLRQDATKAAFDAFGITVTLRGRAMCRPEFGDAMRTVQGIWVQPVTDTDLGGFDVQKDRPSRILALKRGDADGVKRGSELQAHDGYNGRLRVFRVDAPVEIFPDHVRLSLVPDDNPPPDPVDDPDPDEGAPDA